MENELISVIITTYNRPVKIIKRAIDSVVSQTHSNIEIFIINDSPSNTELSKEIGLLVQNYQDDRITYIINTKNVGACAARNVGIKRSTGKFIAFLDDDDEWLPYKLEHQILKFTNEDIGLVYCKFLKLDSNGHVKKSVPIKDIRRNSLHSMLKENAVGSTSFPLIRRECFKNCGTFNIQLQSCQDWDMWLRIIRKYKVEFCNEYLVKYYISDDGITANMKKRLQGWNQMLNINRQDYLKDNNAHVIFLKYISEQLFKNQKYILSLYYTLRAKLVELSNDGRRNRNENN